jgi:hypothetical protein
MDRGFVFSLVRAHYKQVGVGVVTDVCGYGGG